MCASYWNPTTKMAWPKCGQTTTWELQTHFMGELGSYSHMYTIGETIPELQGVSVLLDGRIDDFIGGCPNCKETLYHLNLAGWGRGQCPDGGSSAFACDTQKKADESTTRQ